jgi:hypothetical protein
VRVLSRRPSRGDSGISGFNAGALVGLLALATALSAQTLPLPALPPEEPAVPDPTDPKAPTDPAQAPADSLDTPTADAEERPRSWDYGMGVGAGWSNNIEFEGPEGTSS